MQDADVYTALRRVLTNFSIGSPAQVLNILEPDGPRVVPSIRDPYLRVAFNPGDPAWQPVGIGSTEGRGTFNISIVFPRAYAGPVPPLHIADAVKALYKQGTVLHENGVKVKIFRQTRTAPMVADPVWPSIPIIVSYSATRGAQ